MNQEEFVTKAKEILEMRLKGENLRKMLHQDYDVYFVEKAERALRCLDESY